MLRDVTTNVSDGLLGFATPKGTGIFVAIGASPVESIDPVIITGNMGAAKIKERLGLSPLADSVMDSVDNGANRVYCIPVKAAVDGKVGQIEKTAKGSGKLVADGKPYNDYDVKVEFTGKGGFNSALFTYSIDGALTVSEEITVPLNGEFEIPDTGLKLKFTEGTAADSSFEVGDIYRFTTTAPQMSNANVLDVIDRLPHFTELFEFVHIVGESHPAMWAAVSAAQRELEATYHKPLMFVMEAFKIDESEKVEDYALRLEGAKKQIKNYAVQIVAARSLYVRMDGTTREINNAGIVCGLYAKTNVQKSISRTRESYGMGIKKDRMLELRPAGIKEYIELIDEARYLTFREYDGLDDFYVTKPRMMCPDGSDYRYAEDVRVLHKIIRETRKEALRLLHEDIDMANMMGELEKFAKYLEAPLDTMIDNSEISGVEITIPEDQDIVEGELFDVIIRYASRGYIREIRIDLGRTQIKV